MPLGALQSLSVLQDSLGVLDPILLRAACLPLVSSTLPFVLRVLSLGLLTSARAGAVYRRRLAGPAKAQNLKLEFNSFAQASLRTQPLYLPTPRLLLRVYHAK